jgi:hypothetical protein
MTHLKPIRTSRILHPAIRLSRAAFIMVLLGSATSLRAEPPTAPQGAPETESEQMQTARQLHAEYVGLQQRLLAIQKKAVQAHPELNKQGQDLEALMMSKMTSSTGINAKDEMAAINEMEQKLRDKTTPDSERQKLMPEYQKRVKAFRNAQIQVMQDPEVRKAQAAMMEATIAAMKEQDPQTEELMAQVEQKQAQLQKLIESAGQAK